MRHGILKPLALLLSVILMVSFVAIAENAVSVGTESIVDNSEISVENIDGGLELEDGQYNGDDDIALLDEIELERR